MKKQIGDLDKPHLITYKIFVIRIKKPVIFAIIGIFLALGGITAYLLIAQIRYIKLKAADFYVLCLNSSTSLSQAEQQSNEIADAGGSGYILSDGSFNVSAAAYKKNSDAQIVLNRLKSSYSSAYIRHIKIKELKIQKSGDKNKDSDLKNILQAPLDFTDFLLEQSINLDTAAASESEIIFKLTDYQNLFNKNKKTLTNMLSSSAAETALDKTLIFYEDILKNWEYVSEISQSLGNLSHRIKYFSCFVIDLYSVLRGNIA